MFRPPAHRPAQRHGHRDGNVEALGEAAHGDPEDSVRAFQDIRGNAETLVPENQRDLLVKFQRIEALTSTRQRGGKELEPAGMERLFAVTKGTVLVKVQPLVTALGD